MLKGFVFLLLDFASIYIKSMLNASIFLLQNASICTISTHFASIFFYAKCVDIANAFCYKKKSKCYNCNIGAKCVVTEGAFVTSPVNIYVRGKGVHSRTLPQCKFSFLYRVRIEIILLDCELSLINACCCQADATINSLWRIHRNLLSSIMH